MNFLRRKSKLPSFARRQSAPNHPLPESPLHQKRKEAGGGSSEVGESEDVRKHIFSIREHSHSDVSDREGWILIPNRNHAHDFRFLFLFLCVLIWIWISERLPDDWSDAVDMKVFRSLDRSFVFPGILNFSLMDVVKLVHSIVIQHIVHLSVLSIIFVRMLG